MKSGAQKRRKAVLQREVAIKASVLPAEELIRQFYPGFGWTYVDKNNAPAYQSMILQTWAAQGSDYFSLVRVDNSSVKT